jgi:hypothetical protein
VLSQGGSIAFQAQARFDWDLTEPASVSTAAATGSTGDSGLWATATWAGAYQSQATVFGATGMGSAMAIAIRGAASSRMTLTGIDVAYELGGYL